MAKNAGVSVETVRMGQVVFFRARARQRPAVVTQVWSESCVNLFILPDATDDHQEGMNWLGYCRTSVMRGGQVNEWLLEFEGEAGIRNQE